MNVEKTSAITIKVNDMARSVLFYNRLLGLKVLYGGQNGCFFSLPTLGAKEAILHLERGHVTAAWGQIIFYVENVDRLWGRMREKEFGLPMAPDGDIGGRYFHLHDPN